MPLDPPGSIQQSNSSAMRQRARAIFQHALAECSVSRAFQRSVRFSDGVIRIGEYSYELGSFHRLGVISIGKAGHSMAESLAQIVPIEFGGIVACPVAPNAPVKGFEY